MLTSRLLIAPAALVLGLATLVTVPSASAAGPSTAPTDSDSTQQAAVVPPQTAPDPNARLTFFVGLPYDGTGLEKQARAVSDPTSPSFRRFLPPAQIAARYGASVKAEKSLTAAAKSVGLTATIDPSRLFARVTGPLATWEKLIGAKVQYLTAQTSMFFGFAANDYYIFSPNPQATVVGGIPVPTTDLLETTTYSPAPKQLAPFITWFLPVHAQYVPAADTPPGSSSSNASKGIHGLTYIDNGTTPTNPAPTNGGTPIGTSCVASNGVAITGISGPADQSAFYTPDQVSQAYGLTGLQHKYGAAASGDVTIISLNGGFLQSDLENAANCFGHKAPTVDIRRGTGVDKPFINVDGETSLDLQTVAWTLKNAKSIRLVEATNGPTSFLDGYSTALSDPKGAPAAISLSYGSCESSVIGQPGWRTEAALFQTAAIAGTSVFVSSGDLGSSTCQAGDLLGVAMVIVSITNKLGEGNIPKETAEYLTELIQLALQSAQLAVPTVSYPAVSPWVTAVGATQIALGAGNKITSQAVWNDLQYGLQGNAVSAGATSGLLAAPWYQRPLMSTNLRQVPDVSMLGAATPGMALSVNGQFEVTGGTSEASPMLAASMALVARAASQRLGFVNPWLYQLAGSHPSAFLDVAQGDNQYPIPINETTQNVPACCQAQPGYDAAGGLGSPSFSALLKVG